MSMASAMALALAVFILAASPGPGVFALVAKALSSGLRPALIMLCGIVLGDVIYLIAAALGLSYLAHALGGLFLFIRWGCGVYLIWLGIRLWKTKPQKEAYRAGSASRTPGTFASGLAITLSNPKVILFYCGFLPTFIDLPALTGIDIAVVATIVTGVLLLVLGSYTFIANHARGLFTNVTSIRRLNRAAGGVMVAAGVAVVARS